MEAPDLRGRLQHLVDSAFRGWWNGFDPAQSGPSTFTLVGSMRPLRRFGGREAAAIAEQTRRNTPFGHADVWLQSRALQVREDGVRAELEREDLDIGSFAQPHLLAPARWGYALLDLPREHEVPEYDEADAREVAVAALRHEGLPEQLLGERLVFCRYTYGATRKQPVWLALFEADDEPHLMIINADSDMLLQPVLQ